MGPPPPVGKTHVQNGTTGSYMDAIFEHVVHKESDKACFPRKEGLLQLPD